MTNNDANPSSPRPFDDNDFNPTIALLKLIDARASGLIGGDTVDTKIAELQARVVADIFNV